MRIMSMLASRHMKQNRKRSFFTIAGIVLSVAMITAVSGFVFSAQDALQNLLKQGNGDWHVAIVDVSGEQADSIIEDSMVESGYTKEEGGVLSVYFRLAKPNNGLAQGHEIASRYGLADNNISYHLELLAAEGYMIGTFMAVLYAIGGILGIIIMVGSIIVIANAFAISTGERVRQFGILKSTGATSEQIRMSVLFEGVMLSVIGIPVGILVGLGIEFTGISIANTLMGGMENTNVLAIKFRMIISVVAILISVAASLITVLLSAWFPAKKVSKISAIEAIRLSDEVKIKSRSVKTSWLTHKIFGFEGTLAAKSLKRSRRKYRATVISLVVSIVFVLISASFGKMLFSTLSMIYPNVDATAIVRVYFGIKADEVNQYAERISGFPSTDLQMIGLTYLDMEASDNLYSAEAKKYWDSETPEQANLICLDDTSYAELCKEVGVPAGNFILLNYAMARSEGKRIEFKPIRFAPDTHKVLKPDGSTLMVEVSSQVTAPTPLLKAYSEQNKMNVVVPITFLQDTGLKTEATWFADAPDTVGFLRHVDEKLEDIAGQYVTNNIQAETSMIHNIYLLMMIFVYGFIGILSLIGITSVISTISTNIRLRAQEFAVLKSVGMTPEGLRKMLNLESLLYGVKSLFIGLPLGMTMSYGLYHVFGLVMGFPFLVPWTAIGICILAVMAITFMSMHYAVRQLKTDSIVETMRMVNV